MRALGLGAAALAALVILAGCTLPAPPGDAPLRYRDVVFSSVSVTSDLQYGSAPDLQGNPVALKLDVYQPAGDALAKRPAFVWIHSGGFYTGSKLGDRDVPRYFAQLGYVAISIDYRLLAPSDCAGDRSPPPICYTAGFAAQHDAQAAVRWLRANAAAYRVDPDRIAAAGLSAGADTSLLLAWRADDPGTSGNPGPSSAVRAAVSIAGGLPSNEFIDAGDAPVQFFHGTADPQVFYDWAVSNAAAMLNANIPVVLHPFPDAGHGLLAAAYKPTILQQSSYFLYYMLDLARAPR